MSGHSQFSLLSERRFAPLFWTQFLGAANDNLFKFAFTLLATYESARCSSRHFSSSRPPPASSPTSSSARA